MKGWEDRWPALRRYLRDWSQVELPGGTYDEELASIEAKLGRPLPAGVREWSLLLLDVIRSGRFGDVFRDCDSFDWVEGQRAFSLMVQGEGDLHWAVWEDDLDGGDPPVHGFHYDYGERGFAHMRPWSASVSGWAISHVLAYGELGCAGGIGFAVKEAEAVQAELAASFGAGEDVDELRIYSDGDLMAVWFDHFGFGDGPYLKVLARTAEAKGRTPPALIQRLKRRGGVWSGVFF